MFVQNTLELLYIKSGEEQAAIMMKQVPTVEHGENIE
jgi:hypothetical protein